MHRPVPLVSGQQQRERKHRAPGIRVARQLLEGAPQLFGGGPGGHKHSGLMRAPRIAGPNEVRNGTLKRLKTWSAEKAGATGGDQLGSGGIKVRSSSSVARSNSMSDPAAADAATHAASRSPL